MSSNFGIELERNFYSNTVDGRTVAYRMVVRVVRTNNIDPNIFLYKRVLDALGPNPPKDVFMAVCTPVDLEEYNAGNPAPGDIYYRVADLDLMARNMEQLEDAWTLIKSDCDELVITLETLQTVTGSETSQHGHLPGDEDSSSDSSSDYVDESSSSAPTCSPFLFPKFTVITSSLPICPVGFELLNTDIPVESPACIQVYQSADDTIKVTFTTVTGSIKTFTLYSLVGPSYVAIATGYASDSGFIAITETDIVEFKAE